MSTTSIHERRIQKLVGRVADLKLESDAYPRLPANEEAQIENALAIDHLYYSSAMEGSRLDGEQITLITHEGARSTNDK